MIDRFFYSLTKLIIFSSSQSIVTITAKRVFHKRKNTIRQNYLISELRYPSAIT